MAYPTAGAIFRLSCEDRRGIVATVATFLSDQGLTIHESQQYGDEDTGRFFMRVDARSERPLDLAALRIAFTDISSDFGMDSRIVDREYRPRLVVMVSTQEHCLADLLYRQRTGSLSGDIVAIVSNHPDLRHLADWQGVPFHHVPVTSATKASAEAELRGLLASYEADTIVLARYMQILSEDLCSDYEGRIINIHHSLLPSFKGARPYYQAHARGVKVIGATAHYVTSDLDEGPIICQEFAPVTHSMSAQVLTTMGRDQESLALSRAVQAHSENRVLLNGIKTVVFQA